MSSQVETLARPHTTQNNYKGLAAGPDKHTPQQPVCVRACAFECMQPRARIRVHVHTRMC